MCYTGIYWRIYINIGIIGAHASMFFFRFS